MRLETTAAAESAGTTRLPPEQLVGIYVLPGAAGPAVTIFQKDGQLVQRIDGFRDRSLTYVAGNRYRKEGGTEPAFNSFRMKDGKLQLLVEPSFDPQAIRVKQ